MSTQVAFRWRKSSRSGGANNGCVEVAPVDDAMAVRDSKNPAGGMLRLTAAQWRAFAAAVVGVAPAR